MNFLWLSRCGSQLKLYSFGRKTFFIGITRNNHMFTWMNNRLCLVLGGLTSRSWRPHWSVAAEQSTHLDVIDGGSLITHPVVTTLCYLETTRLFMCPGVTLKLSVIRFITNKQSIYHKSSKICILMFLTNAWTSVSTCLPGILMQRGPKCWLDHNGILLWWTRLRAHQPRGAVSAERAAWAGQVRLSTPEAHCNASRWTIVCSALTDWWSLPAGL